MPNSNPKQLHKKRVVITGIGMVTPLGLSTSEFWENALAGKSIASPVPEHWKLYYTPQSTLWAPLPPLPTNDPFISRIERMQLDPVAILGLMATREALDMAGLSRTVTDEKKNTYSLQGLDPHTCGVCVGTGMGGIASFAGAQGNHLFTAAKKHPLPDTITSMLHMPPRFNPFIVSMVMPNATAADLGIKLGLHGVNKTITMACASGTCAIGEAYQAIAQGEMSLMLAGGSEYLADEYGGIFRGFDTARTLVHAGSDPSKSNCPFDKKRTGFLFAEGAAAFLICESLEHAQARGAHIIAEICGYAESFDAHSMMAVEPSGREAKRMIHAAIHQAGISSEDIGYVNSHGTSTELNDVTEAALIENIFGKKTIVGATKSLIGHTIGAAGAIEAAVTALSLKEQKTHACVNLEDPLSDLSFAEQNQKLDCEYAISQSFAFGGHNGVLVLRRF